MKQYTVTGMSCAACQVRVEKAVSGVPGVTSCAVSLLTNSMGVEGSASPQEVIKAVEAAGYGASERGAEAPASVHKASFAEEEEALRDHETPVLKRRLLISLGFLLVLAVAAAVLLGTGIIRTGITANITAFGLKDIGELVGCVG